jgi:hypothetical protein
MYLAIQHTKEKDSSPRVTRGTLMHIARITPPSLNGNSKYVPHVDLSIFSFNELSLVNEIYMFFQCLITK